MTTKWFSVVVPLIQPTENCERKKRNKSNSSVYRTITCVWNQQAQVSVNPRSSAMGLSTLQARMGRRLFIGIGYQPSKIRKFCIDQTDQTMNFHHKMSQKFGSLTGFTGNLHGENSMISIDIWVNYHISLTWINVRPWMGMIFLMKTP